MWGRCADRNAPGNINFRVFVNAWNQGIYSVSQLLIVNLGHCADRNAPGNINFDVFVKAGNQGILIVSQLLTGIKPWAKSHWDIVPIGTCLETINSVCSCRQKTKESYMLTSF